jgi:hypothetical protein
MNLITKTRNLLLLTLLSSAASFGADAKSTELPTKIRILVGDEVKFEGDSSDLAKKVKPTELKFTEPHLKGPRVFKAFDLKAVLTAVGAKDWEKTKILKATCADGYRPTVTISALKEGKPYLAFDSADKEPFEVKKSGKSIPIKPFYLVWGQDFANEAARGLHLTAGNWPYQLTEIKFEK